MKIKKISLMLFNNLNGVLGISIIIFFILLAIFADFISPHDPVNQNLDLRFKPPVWHENAEPDYILGTDHLGRDIMSRIIYGSRISLTVGFSSVLISCILGIITGLYAGFNKGVFDHIISRIIDIQLSIPYLLLAVSIIMIFGSSMINIIFVLVLYGWTVFARIVRAETLKLANSEFVAAAEIIGNSKFKIVFLHILPNAFNPIIIIATVEIANMIIFEAGLSFLGLGIKPPTPSWGTMLSDGRDYIYGFIWWPSTFAGLSIFFLVFSVNIFGDWLRDHLDPRITN